MAYPFRPRRPRRQAKRRRQETFELCAWGESGPTEGFGLVCWVYLFQNVLKLKLWGQLLYSEVQNSWMCFFLFFF